MRGVSDLGDVDGLLMGCSGRDLGSAGNLCNSSATELYTSFYLSKKSSFSLHGASVKKTECNWQQAAKGPAEEESVKPH